MQSEWARLNKQLFEWTLPSSFFVMLLCLLPIKNTYTRLLLGVVISHTAVNMINQYASTVFGPRYLYETTSSLIMLTAMGITRIPILLRIIHIRRVPRNVMNGIVALPIVLLCAKMVAYSLPGILNAYTHFFANHPDFYQSMLAQSEKPALIFIGREEEAESKYRWVAFTNPPRDSSEVIFAVDRGNAEDIQLAATYPDRHAYVEMQGTIVPLEVLTAP